MKERVIISVVASGILLVPLFLAAQSSEEEGTRHLWNSQFLKKRPQGKTKSKTPPKTIVYKQVGTSLAKTVSSTDSLFGLTLWRMRQPRPADDPNSRLLVIEESPAATSAGELVPERVAIDTPLAEGDRVRLTVEVPRTGYLYVIDREQYADGTTSAAYLIYPNYKTRPGDNAVAAGRVIDIPDQRDAPNHFTIRRGKPTQVAEVLTLLITNEPLNELTIGREPLRLEEAQFKEWETKYGVQAERLELAGGSGAVYTGAEKKAGGDGSTRLTQDDPMPQTLYRVPDRGGQPILLTVPVKIRR